MYLRGSSVGVLSLKGGGMLLTEEEAKTKWCPMSRMEGNNRHWGSQKYISSCIASECMMWRWSDERGKTPDGDRVYITGFCGLGGKP